MDIAVIIVLVICTLAAALAIGARLSRAEKPEKTTVPQSAVSEGGQEFKAAPRGTDPEAVLPITQPVQDNR